MIDEKYMLYNIAAADYKEVFEILGGKLIRNEVVKDGFVEALKKREKEFPTGLPVGIGVAIPHTDGSLVIEDKIVFAVLKNPVVFNEMGGDEQDVVSSKLVILLAIGNGQKHLTVLTKLINTIQNETFLSALIHSESQEEMFRVVQNNLKIEV